MNMIITDDFTLQIYAIRYTHTATTLAPAR